MTHRISRSQHALGSNLGQGLWKLAIPKKVLKLEATSMEYIMHGWGVDHTSQYRYHPLASHTVIVWKVVDQRLILNIISNNNTVEIERIDWCDRRWVLLEPSINVHGHTHHIRGLTHHIHARSVHVLGQRCYGQVWTSHCPGQNVRMR